VVLNNSNLFFGDFIPRAIFYISQGGVTDRQTDRIALECTEHTQNALRVKNHVQFYINKKVSYRLETGRQQCISL